MLSGWGRLVSNKLLKFPRGTNRSSYTQLYVGFFLSGIFHCFRESITQKRIVPHNLKFFLLQAVAITFEDFVIYVTKPLLPQRGIRPNSGKAGRWWVDVVVRVVGYCWVVLCFSLTLPIWLDEASVTGFYNKDRGPIAQFLTDRWKQWA